MQSVILVLGVMVVISSAVLGMPMPRTATLAAETQNINFQGEMLRERITYMAAAALAQTSNPSRLFNENNCRGTAQIAPLNKQLNLSSSVQVKKRGNRSGTSGSGNLITCLYGFGDAKLVFDGTDSASGFNLSGDSCTGYSVTSPSPSCIFRPSVRYITDGTGSRLEVDVDVATKDQIKVAIDTMVLSL